MACRQNDGPSFEVRILMFPNGGTSGTQLEKFRLALDHHSTALRGIAFEYRLANEETKSTVGNECKLAEKIPGPLAHFDETDFSSWQRILERRKVDTDVLDRAVPPLIDTSLLNPYFNTQCRFSD